MCQTSTLTACLTTVLMALLLAGCATETYRALEPQKTALADSPCSGPQVLLSIGKFENRSLFMRGIFNDGVDRLGNQAKTILITHLHQSKRFTVLDRENQSEAQQETRIRQVRQATKGAQFILTGDVTAFGRKEVGDQQLFGILGRGKKQIAYAKVSMNLINVRTSEVVFSAQGAGEYTLSHREMMGFGGTASYDSTLNAKVLDLAIRQAVEQLAHAVDNAPLRGK